MLSRPRTLVLLLLAFSASCAHRYRAARPVAYTWRASPCRVPDAATAAHLHYLRKLASDASNVHGAAEWHAGTRVPVVADTNRVSLVLSPARCADALTAYNRLLQQTDSAAAEIELLEADTVFVAAHPAILSGEFLNSHVFDRRFRYLGSYFQ